MKNLKATGGDGPTKPPKKPAKTQPSPVKKK